MSYNYNRFKDTTVFGNFQNSDLKNGNNANAIFDRDLTVKGKSYFYQDISCNNVKLNGNITANSTTLTPTQIASLNNIFINDNPNIGIGIRALNQTATGVNNCCVGTDTMKNLTTGGTNTAIGGYNALPIVTTGSSNSCFGTSTGSVITSGSFNTLIGYATGDGIISGNYNTAIGSYSYPEGDYSYSTAIGQNAYITGDHQVVLGSSQDTVYCPNALNVTGATTFSTAPTMSGANISSGSIPNSALATAYCDLGSTQTITGSKTFSSALNATGGVSVVGNISSYSDAGCSLTLASNGNPGKTVTISLFPYNGRSAGGSCLLQAKDDGNFSSDFYISTALTGTGGSVAQPRMKIASDGTTYFYTGYNTDGSQTKGTTIIGNNTNNYSGNYFVTNNFAVTDNNTNTMTMYNKNVSNYGSSFALYQGVNGDTVLNAASGQNIGFKNNNNSIATIDSNGLSVSSYTTATGGLITPNGFIPNGGTITSAYSGGFVTVQGSTATLFSANEHSTNRTTSGSITIWNNSGGTCNLYSQGGNFIDGNGSHNSPYPLGNNYKYIWRSDTYNWILISAYV